MKLSLIFSLIFGALLISGCRKDDNQKVPDLDKLPIPLISLGEGAGLKIPVSDPAAYSATVVVDTYFKFGEKPKQYDLVVIKNGDKSNPKVLQSGITTFPTSVTVSGQQLKDLFGEDIVLDDQFDIGADVITLDGRKYDAFPAEGITYAPGIANLPGSNTDLTLTAANFCFFVADEYTDGDYEVVVDEWNDYGVGDPVHVTKIDDTHYSFEYAADNAQPIVMEVDPITNAISVEPVLYGSYDFGPPIGSVNFIASGVEGEADPCDHSFHVLLNHEAEGFGDQGNYLIVLKKL